MLTKKFCPKCKGENVDMIAGGTVGSWICRDCGYSGSLFPEKPILGGEMNTNINNGNSKKGRKNKRLFKDEAGT